jgi:hypothetical protein
MDEERWTPTVDREQLRIPAALNGVAAGAVSRSGSPCRLPYPGGVPHPEVRNSEGR